MLEIEKYSCNDGNEARARERYWIEKEKSTLNVTIPNRSKKEYEKIAKIRLPHRGRKEKIANDGAKTKSRE
jgi:glycine cleavage system H lipoate-binding protein